MSFFYILFGVFAFNLYLVALFVAIVFETYLVVKAATPTGLIVPPEDRRWMFYENRLFSLKPSIGGQADSDEVFGASSALFFEADKRTLWESMGLMDFATRHKLLWLTPRKVAISASLICILALFRCRHFNSFFGCLTFSSCARPPSHSRSLLLTFSHLLTSR